MDGLVAVVTRTHNRNVLLKRALLSVASQGYGNYIHIIINDAGDSTAVQRTIEEALGPQEIAKVKQIDIPLSKGREAAVNPGFQFSIECGADYIAVLDDDDTWSSDYLDKMTLILARQPALVAVACGVDVIHEIVTGNTIVESGRERFGDGFERVSLLSLLRKNFIPPVSLLFRATVLDVLRGWREDLPVLADWDFNLRLAMLGEIGFLNEPLSQWHHRTTEDPDLGNSIVVSAKEHKEYVGVIRDEYLRSLGRGGDQHADGSLRNALALPLVYAGMADNLSDLIERNGISAAEHREVLYARSAHDLQGAIDVLASNRAAHLEAVQGELLVAIQEQCRLLEAQVNALDVRLKYLLDTSGFRRLVARLRKRLSARKES